MCKVWANKIISVFVVIMLILSCVNYPTFSASADDYEYAWFPVNQVRLTQLAFESVSHSYSYHFDCVGSKAVGSDYAFAPFTGKIVYIDASWGFCGLQSTDANGNPKKVYWADGSLDYMTVWFMHGSNVSSLSKGQIITQGTEFFREGSVGAGAAHYDIGVSRGQITTPKDQTGQGVGNYCGCGSDYPYNAFFLNRSKTPSIVNPGKLQGKFVGGSNNKSDWTGLWRDLNATPPVSGMTISGQTLPPSPHTLGNNFGVYGVISSNLPISLVWGGVYKSDWTVTDQYAEASPNTTSYDLHGYFNDKLIFDYLPAGSYHYFIKARDTSGTEYELINHDFTVVDPNVKTYTIKYDANTGTGTMENSNMTYGQAANLRKNTFTKTGYSFESWSDGNGNYYSDQQSVKDLATGGIVTLWAKWKPNTYTVKFNGNGGSGTMSNLSMTYDTAKNLTTNTFKRDGYTFLGWSTDKAATTAKYTDKQSVKNLTATANETVTLYAVWSDKTAPKITNTAAESVSMTGFKITATISDVVGVKSVTANVNSWRGFDADGKSITLKQSNGIWTADVKVSDFNNTYGAYYFTVIATDTNGNVAKSDSIEVKIGVITCTFNPNGGIVDPTSKTLVYGEKYSRLEKLPTPSKTGHVFDGWYTDKTGGTKITDDTIVTETKDHTLYAHWKLNSYLVKFDAAGGTVLPTSIHVTYSKIYDTLPIPELKGYRFVGWFTEEGTEITDKTTVTINHDHTLTAHWKLNVPENLELRNGDQYQLDMPDEALTYKSNNANVAVVSKSGVITAVSRGEAIITVLDAEDNAYQVKLTVLPVMLQGDINLDGQVNISDAILLQKWLLAVPDTKLSDWRAGDLYSDNSLDVFDLCLLKRMLIYG